MIILAPEMIQNKAVKIICCARDAQIFQKSRSHFKILGTRQVTRSKFHTEDPQMLAPTIQNLVTTVTWCQRFCNVMLCYYVIFNYIKNLVCHKQGIHLKCIELFALWAVVLTCWEKGIGPLITKHVFKKWCHCVLRCPEETGSNRCTCSTLMYTNSNIA